MSTNDKSDQFRDWLRPQLTDEFLATLVEAARVDGYMSNWSRAEDVIGFVEEMFGIAGKQPPNLGPYESVPEKASEL